MSEENIKKIIRYILIPLIIFFSFLIYYQNYLYTLPIRYWDEARWIERSYFYELYIKKDFQNPLWNSSFAYDQPRLTEYVFGSVLYPYYLQEKANKGKDYDMGKFLIDHNFSMLEGGKYMLYRFKNMNFIDWESFNNYSPEYLLNKFGKNFGETLNIIYLVRNTNAFILALVIVIVYFIALVSFGDFVAYITALFYGFNKVVLNTSLIAHSEALFLLFFNLSLLCLIFIFRKEKTGACALILFAIFAAFCTQTKINGIMLFGIFSIIYTMKILGYMINKAYRKARIGIIKIILVNLLGISIFMMLDPFTYKNPLNNSLKYFESRVRISLWQMEEKLSPPLTNPFERVMQISNRFLLKADENDSYMMVFLTDGLRFPAWLVAVLFIVGITVLLYYSFRTRILVDRQMVLFWSFIFTSFAMSFYLYLDRNRYYVQLVLFFLVFESFGLWVLLKMLLCRFRSRRGPFDAVNDAVKNDRI